MKMWLLEHNSEEKESIEKVEESANFEVYYCANIYTF